MWLLATGGDFSQIRRTRFDGGLPQLDGSACRRRTAEAMIS
jgi:hypothetical protein